MLDILKNGVGWVTMRYPDGSVRVIKTTMREDILEKYGAELKNDRCYDLVRGEYVLFSDTVSNIEVSSDIPVFDDEVINFANRFI